MKLEIVTYDTHYRIIHREDDGRLSQLSWYYPLIGDKKILLLRAQGWLTKPIQCPTVAAAEKIIERFNNSRSMRTVSIVDTDKSHNTYGLDYKQVDTILNAVINWYTDYYSQLGPGGRFKYDKDLADAIKPLTNR